MLGGPHTQPFQPRSSPEVLSYYVHGMPFVRGEDSLGGSEYTLAGARSAAAARLQAGAQRAAAGQAPRRHQDDPNIYPHHLHPGPSEPMYALAQQPQHSFYPGFYPGSRMTQYLGEPTNNHTLVHQPFHTQQRHSSPSRTPPTPALSDGARSAATSPDQLDEHYFQPRMEPAWALHDVFSKPLHHNYGKPYVAPYTYDNDFVETTSSGTRPGVGPRGHVLGGGNRSAYPPEQTYAAPAQDHYARPQPSAQMMGYANNTYAGSQLQYTVTPAHVGPTGHVLGERPTTARPRGVGPSGHVLGGRKPAQPEVLYTSPPAAPPGLAPPPGLPVPASRIPVLKPNASSKMHSPARHAPGDGNADSRTLSPPRAKAQSRPRALSRLSSMNLQNGLDTVVEEDEPAPPLELFKSLHLHEGDDSSETASEDFAHDNLALRTPRDEITNIGIPSVKSSGDESADNQGHEVVVALDNMRMTPVVQMSRAGRRRKSISQQAPPGRLGHL